MVRCALLFLLLDTRRVREQLPILFYLVVVLWRGPASRFQPTFRLGGLPVLASARTRGRGCKYLADEWCVCSSSGASDAVPGVLASGRLLRIWFASAAAIVPVAQRDSPFTPSNRPSIHLGSLLAAWRR